MIKVGSTWTTADSVLFEVRAVETKEDGIWVYYGKYGQDRTYNCLIGAFLSRFREHLN